MASAVGSSCGEDASYLRLVVKALDAYVNGWHALATTYYRRAARLACELHGATLISVHLTLQQASE